MATPVVFKIGTRAQYNALQEKNPNALYFLTDTKEIYRGADGLAQNSYYEDIKTIETSDEEVIAKYYENNVDKYEVKGDIFVVKTLVADEVYSHSAFIYDGTAWKSISTSVLSDNASIELNGGLLTLKDFGKRYYKFIAETGSEAEGNLVPAHYEPVDVDAEHPWAAGLEPKVVLDNNKLVIGWYEPNPTTAEGVQDQVTAVQGTVADVQQTVTNVQEDVKNLDEEVKDINKELYGEGEGETAVPGLIAEVEALNEDLATNYYTKSETYSQEEINNTIAEINGKIAGVFHFKGVADSYETLPTENLVAGDVYQVGDKEYAWNGEDWVELGFTVDLSKHATIEYVDGKVKAVADDLDLAEAEIIDHEDRLGVIESTLNTEETGLVAVANDLQTRVKGLEDVGAEKNVLIGVTANGIELVPNAGRIIDIPVFTGSTAGLVPVVGAELTNKANLFLNAEGNWASINIGNLGEYASITDYIDAKTAEAAPIWSEM